jgi:PAS domain S-box-containing protein
MQRTLTALRESEEKMRTIAEFTHDWECWITPDGAVKYMSPSCERITGYTPAEFMADPSLLKTIIHPDDRNEALYQDGVHVDMRTVDFRIIRRDGGVRWIQRRSLAIIDSDGRNLGWRGSNRDVTSQKEAEIALKAREAFLSAYIAAMPDLAFLLDEHGRYIDILSINDELLYMPLDELKGKTVDDILPEDIAKNVLKAIARTLSTGEVQMLEYKLDVPAGTRWFEGRSSTMRIDGGNRHLIVWICRDITDRKNMEEQLRSQTEDLEKLVEQRTAQVVQSSKLASLGTFAAGVAHEKRQYMQAILSNAERIVGNIDRYYETGDYEGYRTFVKERIATIESTIMASNELIQSLIDYSRGDQVRYDLISPREQIEHTLRIIGHALTSDYIILDIDLADTPKIVGNEMQIREIVLNLITNSRYAVNAAVGIPEKHIGVKLNSDTSHIRMIVSDNGIGMTPEQAGKMFDPFYTTKSPREGTGLGLSLVYTYVENHHGIIRVQSAPGKGATVEVTIPLHRTLPDGT